MPPVPTGARAAGARVRGYGVEAVVGCVVLLLAVAVLLPVWLFGGFERA